MGQSPSHYQPLEPDTEPGPSIPLTMGFFSSQISLLTHLVEIRSHIASTTIDQAPTERIISTITDNLNARLDKVGLVADHDSLLASINRLLEAREKLKAQDAAVDTAKIDVCVGGIMKALAEKSGGLGISACPPGCGHGRRWGSLDEFENELVGPSGEFGYCGYVLAYSLL